MYNNQFIKSTFSDNKLNTSAGIQGYNPVSSTPRVQSVIENQIECLEREVNNLDMLSEQLYTRLTTVLRQVGENVECEPKDKLSFSPLPEAIFQKTEKIKVVELRLIDILERLEL